MELLSFSVKKSLITIIYSYPKIFLSVFISPRCRFRPTCSQYSSILVAISTFGLIQRNVLTIKCIVHQCHPLNFSSFDMIHQYQIKNNNY